jgi:membrane dipeptidase
MNHQGMIIDTAHMNHQSMMDVVRCSKKPILNSHSNLKAFASHTRNVEDEFLDALAQNGGVL